MHAIAEMRGGQPPRPPRNFCQYESNEVLTNLRQSEITVQGEVPMTVQCESVAPLFGVRRDADFILEKNTSAGGSRPIGTAIGAST